MINLLPDSHKKELRAARTNVVLVRYISILGGAIGVLAILVGAAYILLMNTQQNVQAQVDENVVRVSSFDATRTEADRFRSDLANAKIILDGEITYSQLIYDISDVIPKDVILDSLTLDSQTLGSKATMNASARTYEAAVKLKEVFVNNPKLFTGVYFETLSYQNSEDASKPEPYPVKVTMSVVIMKEAL